jgi:hypothetical protein
MPARLTFRIGPGQTVLSSKYHRIVFKAASATLARCALSDALRNGGSGLTFSGFLACRLVSQSGRETSWLCSRKTSKPMTKPPQQRLPDFASQDGLVKIMTTTKPRRFPPHDFPVVVLRLRPRQGTRVLQLPDGSTELMPRYGEVFALCMRMGLLITVPPDKPAQRRRRFERLNARRHRRTQ